MPPKTCKAVDMQLGPYELLKKIGEGGMGTVYKARDTRDDQIVAVKVLSADSAKNSMLVERFKQEYRAAESLHHPHIVRGLDFGVHGDTPFMVMEFVDGESLGDRIDRLGKIPEEDAVAIIGQIAEALHLTHKHHIIHRDVKPDNILVTLDGHAKLTDLGLVKDWQTDLDLTRPSSGLGTPNFMAPEQFGNAKNADRRCDLYSLGATLYMAVTGEVPFHAKTNLNLVKKKMQDDVVRPRQLTPRLSQRVENAILKAMRANPNERFTDCPDFMNALADPDRVQETAELDRPGEIDPAPREKVDTKSSANRRAAVRYPSSLDSTCHPMARVKERTWAGKVQDVSATGVCLVLGRRFEPGTLLTAEFKGKRRGTQSTRLVRVLRVIEKIKGKYLIGCAFQRPLSEAELRAMV